METLTNEILSQTIRIRPEESHKGTYGRVCLVGGNDHFGGAILMATEAKCVQWGWSKHYSNRFQQLC